MDTCPTVELDAKKSSLSGTAERTEQKYDVSCTQFYEDEMTPPLELGDVTGYPGVFQGNPHPCPWKPVPVAMGTGFARYGLWVLKNPGVIQLERRVFYLTRYFNKIYYYT